METENESWKRKESREQPSKDSVLRRWQRLSQLQLVHHIIEGLRIDHWIEQPGGHSLMTFIRAVLVEKRG